MKSSASPWDTPILVSYSSASGAGSATMASTSPGMHPKALANSSPQTWSNHSSPGLYGTYSPNQNSYSSPSATSSNSPSPSATITPSPRTGTRRMRHLHVREFTYLVYREPLPDIGTILQSHDDYMFHFRTEMCQIHSPDTKPMPLCFDAHSKAELRRKPSWNPATGQYSYIARKCRFLYNGQTNAQSEGCKKGNRCCFSHSDIELCYHPSKYKTVMCNQLPGPDGICTQHGVHCAKAHIEAELRVARPDGTVGVRPNITIELLKAIPAVPAILYPSSIPAHMRGIVSGSAGASKVDHDEEDEEDLLAWSVTTNLQKLQLDYVPNPSVVKAQSARNPPPTPNAMPPVDPTRLSLIGLGDNSAI